MTKKEKLFFSWGGNEESHHLTFLQGHLKLDMIKELLLASE